MAFGTERIHRLEELTRCARPASAMSDIALYAGSETRRLFGMSREGELPLDRLLVSILTMPRKIKSGERGDLLQGTLDMLVLRTVLGAPAHGHTIAHVIEKTSHEVLQVEHGSLYPALHRLEEQGLIASFWGTSENNRRAKYYRITPAGKKYLHCEHGRWESLVQAIRQVLGPRLEKE